MLTWRTRKECFFTSSPIFYGSEVALILYFIKVSLRTVNIIGYFSEFCKSNKSELRLLYIFWIYDQI